MVLSTLYIDDVNLYKLHQRLTASKGVYIVAGIPNYKAKYEVDSEYLV